VWWYESLYQVDPVVWTSITTSCDSDELWCGLFTQQARLSRFSLRDKVTLRLLKVYFNIADVAELSRALDVRLSDWCRGVSMVFNLSVQRSNCNHVWFNFQTYIYIYIWNVYGGDEIVRLMQQLHCSYYCLSWRGVLDITLCHKEVCQWLAADRWFSPRTPISSTNKTYRHDITEILLKVALNITPLIQLFSKSTKIVEFSNYTTFYCPRQGFP